MSRLYASRTRATSNAQARPNTVAEPTHALILDQAAKLFRSFGYENTSLAMIAEAIDLTAPAIYRHFPSKYDLFARSVEKLQTDFDDRMEQVSRSGSPRERIRELTIAHALHQLRRAVPESTGSNRVLTIGQLAVHLLEPERSRVLGLQRRHLDRVRETIEAGVAAGEFDVADETVAAFSALALPENLVLWYKRQGRLSEEQVARMLGDHVLRMLGADPAP